MKKFLVLFSAPAETRAKMQSATPEEMQASMQPWMDWFAKMGNALVDRGMPLTNAMALTKEGTEPGDPQFVAYDIVEAESIDAALALMKSNPHVDREGGKIEVHEMWDMNGMIK
jgi:hypothetical protein